MTPATTQPADAHDAHDVSDAETGLVAPDSPAQRSASALIAGLIAFGVRDIVLSPGSRSQALALAAAAAARASLIELHVRVDERVAGFTALGLAAESGIPVVVMCTSGTAVANLHPAVLEAHHSGTGIIVLSADRPSELRGIGSNQTTVQPGIFGDLVRADWDVPAPIGSPGERDDALDLAELAVRAAAEGPVHLNLAYREPLSGAVDLPVHERREAETPTTSDSSAIVLDLEPDDATVVIAGAGAGPLATELAEQLGAPLIAEVASEARFGRHVVAAYREVLRGPHGDAVARAVVVGHPTLSREVPALLKRDDVETIVIRTPGVEVYDPGRNARIVDAVRVHGTPDPAIVRRWVGGWVAMSRAVLESEAPDDPAPNLDEAVSEEPSVRSAFARAEMAIMRAPVDRRMLARALWASTWPHDRLVLGASRLIREADRIVPGKRIPVHANRGLSGIDGTISTATGIALAARHSERRGVVRVLLGDLATVHDAGAFLVPLPDDVMLHVFVGDDGGGTIFDSLEVADTADPQDFRRVMRTPVNVDFAALAAAGGWKYRLVETRSELDDALTAPERRLLVHIPLHDPPPAD
jgi:2-succinyl-5-enolpyruvyl-6-hydroxy-3-cyclohexene-1-carboxylate synthase